MSQPVKLSDALVLDARLAGQILERSIAGQVVYWARLGRAVDALLEGSRALALCRDGAATSLSACLDAVDTPAGRERVGDVLAALPFPHYEAAPDSPGLLVRVNADGRRVTGRFVKRRFVPEKGKSPRR
jgi:hypothetical protein